MAPSAHAGHAGPGGRIAIAITFGLVAWIGGALANTVLGWDGYYPATLGLAVACGILAGPATGRVAGRLLGRNAPVAAAVGGDFLLAAMGAGLLVLGAWLAGRTEVTCVRDAPGAAVRCTVSEYRWLGCWRAVERAVPGVRAARAEASEIKGIRSRDALFGQEGSPTYAFVLDTSHGLVTVTDASRAGAEAAARALDPVLVQARVGAASARIVDLLVPAVAGVVGIVFTLLPLRRAAGRRWKTPGALALLALISAPAAARATGQAAAVAPGWQDDVTALKRFLEQDRSYSASARAAAREEIERLGRSATPLPAAALQLAAARVAALAGNGHTLVIPAFWPYQFNRIPVRLHLFADGLFVIHAPSSLVGLRGARLVSIEGHGVDALRRAFARHSGARESKRDEWIGFFLESPALLHAAGLARRDDRITVALVLADGTRQTRVLQARLDPPAESPMRLFFQSRLVSHAAENASAVPLSLAEPERFFRRATLPDLDAGYVQLRANASVESEQIAEFLSQALTALRERMPRNLVVDLRFDGGGDLNTTRDFFEALPSLLPPEGRIFALTSGRTFSAGISSLGYLEQAGGARVTIVGEPIGDRLEFWAEGDVVELPASRARMLFATERHDYTTGCPEADCHAPVREHPIRVTSLEPDLLVPLTYADYRAGRDPALEAVARLLGRR